MRRWRRNDVRILTASWQADSHRSSRYPPNDPAYRLLSHCMSQRLLDRRVLPATKSVERTNHATGFSTSNFGNFQTLMERVVGLACRIRNNLCPHGRIPMAAMWPTSGASEVVRFRRGAVSNATLESIFTDGPDANSNCCSDTLQRFTGLERSFGKVGGGLVNAACIKR
jgi:hypothetical protein